MELNEAIQGRRSIRSYTPKEMPEADLQAILEAAMLAPSACNTRPWEFLVLQSDQAKAKVLEIHPYARHLAQASVGVLVCGRPDLQSGVAEGYFPQDCGAAVENMLLRAYSLGYGSCWCGIYPRENRVQLFREAFDLKSVPFALVVIGAPNENPAPRGFYDPSRVTVL